MDGFGAELTSRAGLTEASGMAKSSRVDDSRLFELARRVGERLLAAGVRLATAESCTGGWIAKAMTDVAGSSAWLECGFIVYSNEAKVRDLGVSQETLRRHGAVSEATVREMAQGAVKVSGAQIAVSVSGIAGPDGAMPGKPVGTVCFAVAMQQGDSISITARSEHFAGDREAVRRRSVEYALELVLGAELPRKP
jgi:nicotinamide-nucleotide amidase